MASSSRKATASRSRPRKQRKADSKDAGSEKRGVNTSGLAVLPDELRLEIVSHLPSPDSPELSEKHSHEDVRAYEQQRDLFLALSMTCQHLRQLFRPYLWRRLEVTSGMRIGETILRPQSGKKGETAYATELVRLLEIVTIRNPSLAEYVQIANFEITDFSINSVLVELGRCFSLFPNLHTVKLDMHNSSRRWDMVVNGFQKHVYPSIRHVILAPPAYPLLLSCPNVKSVHCVYDTIISGLSEYLHKSPCIDRVGCSLTQFRFAVQALPNVRQLRLHCELFYGSLSNPYVEEILDNLVVMRQLQEVVLEISWGSEARDIIIWKVTQHLQNLFEQDGAKKQILVIDLSPLSLPLLRQTITVPPKKTPSL